MTAMTYEYHVTMANGQEFDVTADQRDIAAFEMEPYGVSFFQIHLKPFTFARYMAWRAGQRAKLHAFSWTEWADECVNVDGDETEDGIDADPGKPEASAGT